jgi:hypothetical protein
MRPNISLRIALLGVVVFLSGCDSERLKEFSSLAAAGSAYAATFPTLTNQLGSAHIMIDSDFAISQKKVHSQDPSLLAKAIGEQDVQLKHYLATLDKLNAHAALLGAYFDAMAQMANTKNSEQVATSANGLLTHIGDLNATIKNAKIGTKTISDFLEVESKLVVAHFQVKALDENIQTHADVIDKALSLQEAAIKAIRAELTDDLSNINQFNEQDKVIGPFVASGTDVPKSWSADREAYIRSTLMLENADAAQNAITKLRGTFRDVVQDKGAQVDFNGLLTAIGGMAGYANAVKAAVTNAN